MATERTIKTVLNQFLQIYPLTQADGDIASLIGVWVAVLGDVPDQPLHAAALEYLKSAAQWRPVPGQLRARTLELAGASVEDRAREAWNRCCDINDEAMTKEARKQSDEIAVRAIRQMRANMRRLREDATVEEIMGERERAFCQAYANLVARCDALALGRGAEVAELGVGDGG